MEHINHSNSSLPDPSEYIETQEEKKKIKTLIKYLKEAQVVRGSRTTMCKSVGGTEGL